MQEVGWVDLSAYARSTCSGRKPYHMSSTKEYQEDAWIEEAPEMAAAIYQEF